MPQRLLVLLAALVALPLSACCGGSDYLQAADPPPTSAMTKTAPASDVDPASLDALPSRPTRPGVAYSSGSTPD
ncbi:MAG: hypothetical protein AAF170_00995 [Bacteroidota bacterium]